MFTFTTSSSTRSSSPTLHPNSRLPNGVSTIRRIGNVAAKDTPTATAATEILPNLKTLSNPSNLEILQLYLCGRLRYFESIKETKIQPCLGNKVRI
ncbi:hypothetical protein RHGRI_014130 [Rhododendron griersonianum]|uniref:Uncharacterized protein n=1 Tax=Rhododendron griersonianum TaxID=479676 RepID=A0AAV6K874_9ERIC|nr:hypothetical protein RHGRI_014130 [Rhododendron griersonianum]